jgi:hypothetical protein
MPQLFQRRANAIARATLIAVPLVGLGAWAALFAFARSDFWTRVDSPVEQPVPFSHQHHVAGLGIDCRYCHTSVEKAAFAGMPSTDTCMTCHSQLWTDAPLLAPVRESLATNTPIKWNRVHDLPDFTYFDHSIHVAKGVGCSTCHGAVDQMPLTFKTQTLYMKWCLDCHRQPQNFVRPREEVFNMGWNPQKEQPARGAQLVRQYHIDTSGRLTNCSVCHR